MFFFLFLMKIPMNIIFGDTIGDILKQFFYGQAALIPMYLTKALAGQSQQTANS